MSFSSTEIVTHKIHDNLDTACPEFSLKSNCLYKTCKNPDCKVSWHYPCKLTKNGTKGFVRKLRPIATMIAAGEIVMGVTLLVLLVLNSRGYDEFFGTKDSKVISLAVFYGLVALIVTGLMLSIALVFYIRRMLWIYILLSSMLSVYTFALAVIKINFALLVLETVVHFMGNVTVFSYHNLKYIHPVLFETPS